MAILVDMNQISVASVMMHLHMTKQTKPDEDMVRHMILNSLRMYRMKFCDEYGELFYAMTPSTTGAGTTTLSTSTIARRGENPLLTIGMPSSKC
jgi:hypothetical protein